MGLFIVDWLSIIAYSMVFLLISVNAIKNGKKKIWGIIGVAISVIYAIIEFLSRTVGIHHIVCYITDIITFTYAFLLVAAEGGGGKNKRARNILCIALALVIAIGGFSVYISTGESREYIWDYEAVVSVWAYDESGKYLGWIRAEDITIWEDAYGYGLWVRLNDYSKRSEFYEARVLVLYVDGERVDETSTSGGVDSVINFSGFDKYEMEDIREALRIQDSNKDIYWW